MEKKEKIYTMEKDNKMIKANKGQNQNGHKRKDNEYELSP